VGLRVEPCRARCRVQAAAGSRDPRETSLYPLVYPVAGGDGMAAGFSPGRDVPEGVYVVTECRIQTA